MVGLTYLRDGKLSTYPQIHVDGVDKCTWRRGCALNVNNFDAGAIVLEPEGYPVIS